MTTKRDLIVVDVETTGLLAHHAILEVAAVNVETGAYMHFAPFVTATDLGAADGDAMRINRYYERGVYRNVVPSVETPARWIELQDMLSGQTFAGSNPRFDADRIGQALNNYGADVEPWHHRLADLSAYAAGALGISPAELPGLAEICKRLEVDPGVAHSALDDAKATAECFRRLIALRGAA
jgi:DNA polymerase III subunit epsilon